MYSTSLLIVHVISAIIGIGATFTFGVLGSLSGRIEGPGAIALLEGNLAIEKFLVRPFALLLLPLSGALMIFKRGWSTNFFSHTWLLTAIVLYVIAAGVATGILTPGVKKLIELGKGGQAGTPEFNRIVSIQQRLGTTLDVVVIVIVVLMVWKPGG
jgi:uncharacterized membrane protein